jgi:hypothetical protein
MQPNDEADELQRLLQEEYGAPRLDKQFSADLVARLQAEATAPQSLTPAKPRRPLLAICLAIAAVAASIVAVIWVSQPETPGTNHKVAQRVKTDLDLNSLAESEIQESRKSDLGDHMSVVPRSMSVSPESERMLLSESLSGNQSELARNQSESKHPAASSLAPTEASLVIEERKPGATSLTTKLSTLDIHPEERPNTSAMVALADMLYVVDSGHLYEVSPCDGSRRSLGDDHWRNTAAMGAAGGLLYIVSDHQLYEVNPMTGVRRSVGKSEWAKTTAIVTAGDKLYIISGGLLHRVNPRDGSHELLHSKNESPNPQRQPKP